jgi:hypothetical protein
MRKDATRLLGMTAWDWRHTRKVWISESLVFRSPDFTRRWRTKWLLAARDVWRSLLDEEPPWLVGDPTELVFLHLDDGPESPSRRGRSGGATMKARPRAYRVAGPPRLCPILVSCWTARGSNPRPPDREAGDPVRRLHSGGATGRAGGWN